MISTESMLFLFKILILLFQIIWPWIQLDWRLKMCCVRHDWWLSCSTLHSVASEQCTIQIIHNLSHFIFTFSLRNDVLLLFNDQWDSLTLIKAVWSFDKTAFCLFSWSWIKLSFVNQIHETLPYFNIEIKSTRYCLSVLVPFAFVQCSVSIFVVNLTANLRSCT